MKNLNDLTANDAIRVDSAEQWNQLAPMLDASKWRRCNNKKFVDIKFYKPIYLRGFDCLGVTYTIYTSFYNIIPASEFLTDKNNEPMKEKPMSNEMPSDEWKSFYQKHGKPIGKPLIDYVKEKHSQDRCVGFIDGYEKAFSYERWKAERFAEFMSHEMKGWIYRSEKKHWFCMTNWKQPTQTTAELMNGEEFKEYLEKRRKEEGK